MPESLTGQFLAGTRRDRGPDASGASRPATSRSRVRRSTTSRDRREGAAGGAVQRHRRLGLGQVDARQRGPATRRSPTACTGTRPARRRAQADQRARAARQDHLGRPVADRAHAALEPGHLHRAVRPDPRPVLQDAGGAGARLQAGPLLVQRQGRALRGLQGRRPDQDRDALPARTCTCRASSATASATTARRSRSASRARRSPTCSRCRSRRRSSSSRTSPRSGGGCRR